jgi:hypothetical protein
MAKYGVLASYSAPNNLMSKNTSKIVFKLQLKRVSRVSLVSSQLYTSPTCHVRTVTVCAASKKGKGKKDESMYTIF